VEENKRGVEKNYSNEGDNRLQRMVGVKGGRQKRGGEPPNSERGRRRQGCEERLITTEDQAIRGREVSYKVSKRK